MRRRTFIQAATSLGIVSSGLASNVATMAEPPAGRLPESFGAWRNFEARTRLEEHAFPLPEFVYAPTDGLTVQRNWHVFGNLRLQVVSMKVACAEVRETRRRRPPLGDPQSRGVESLAAMGRAAILRSDVRSAAGVPSISRTWDQRRTDGIGAGRALSLGGHPAAGYRGGQRSASVEQWRASVQRSLGVLCGRARSAASSFIGDLDLIGEPRTLWQSLR